MESALLELIGEGEPEDLVPVLVRLHDDGAVPASLRVIARFGRIATCRVRRCDVAGVRALLASMKRPQVYGPVPWEEGHEGLADDATDDLLPRPGDARRTAGLSTGRGVAVAHLDWGMDITHPAFRRDDGGTRLLALWDQGAAYDPAHPNRYGFGRIFLRDEIDRALARPDPHAALGYRWWTSDRGGGSHGTHTLGISSGRAYEDGIAGFATDADLIFVDLTTRLPEGPQPLGSSTDLIEGCDFAIRIAGNRPLVINASLGRQAGEHDGCTLTEQALDAMLSEAPGRAMTMSCGNYFGKNAHAFVTLDPGESADLELELAAGTRPAELDMWYPRADGIDVELYGPDGIRVGPVSADRNADLVHLGRSVGRLYNRSDDPNNGDSQVSLFFYGDAPAGEWRLRLHGRAIGDGRVHLWIERDPAGAGRLTFSSRDVVSDTTLGTICNGFWTIAVAAYDAHSDDRPPGRFSSAGPTRDGRTSRPGCAAPGVQVLSARSAPRDGAAAPPSSRMSGTSMAAPYAAGIVAMMFDAAPRKLWIDETRAALIGTLEPVPPALRSRLGAGYLAAVAAVAQAATVDPLLPPRSPAARTPRTPPARLRPLPPQEPDMTDPDKAWPVGEDDDCDADSETEDAEVERAAEAAFDEDDRHFPEMEDGLEADGGGGADAEARRRGGGRDPLPFQFQIPIGGGAGGLGLAVPIGGRSSPFALSVPLTSPPTPAMIATPVIPMTPVAPGAATPADPIDAPVTTALDLPPEAIEFAGDASDDDTEAEAAASEDRASLAEALAIDEAERDHMVRDFTEVDARYAGEQLMAAITHADGPWASPGEMLHGLGEVLDDAAGEAETERAPDIPLPELFHLLADPSAGSQRLCGRRIHVLLRPNMPIGNIVPIRGDLLLRIVPGYNWVQLGFVASAGLVSGSRTRDHSLRAEGDPAMLPGRYVHVVEFWPVRRDEDQRFARRVANAADLTLHDTILLRLVPGGETFEAAPEKVDDDEAPTLMPGMHGSVVLDLQRRLNALHARREALGLIGLGDMPLAEDGVYGARMRDAVLALQSRAPVGLIARPDGVVGPSTWRALALLEATAALVSQREEPARAPRRAIGAWSEEVDAVAAGELVERQVPLLQPHRGTQPDLILRWNAMGAVPERLDVVVHLHGFSGRGRAMQIDRDKLPNSGLDFVNPANPAEPGRTTPLLAILPRGNFYGGKSGAGYDFPALVPPTALGQLITLSLARFAAATGVTQPAMGRLILTGHSGGGAALMQLLANHDPDEVHCFDALYGSPRPLIRWAEAKLRGGSASTAALRVLYRDREGTAANSRQVAAALASAIATADGSPDLARRWRVEPVTEPHNGIPRRYGWRLLADAGTDLDGRQASQERDPEASRWDDAGEQAASGPGLTQAEVDTLAAREFGDASELEAHFASAGGFASWFNANLSGHAPFVRPGRGGALAMPTGTEARARFAAFWDRPDAAYDRPRVSLLEFASLMAIVLNETGGDFAGHVESSGRGGGGRTDARGRHPGLAYFFDTIELQPGRFKGSYNHMSGGRTAGSLFDDPVYIRAHGGKGGADRLAGQGGASGGAWNGRFYPQDAFSTREDDPATAFIREADFYKFRGRGIIQTTGRASYLRHAAHVRDYRGGDAALQAIASRWAGLADQEICTESSNADWDRIFAAPETLGLGLRFHAASDRYQHMSRDADILNAVPASGQRGRSGSIYQMGRRISGSPAYGAGLYRDRVLALMRAMLALVPVAPAPTRSRDGLELVHRPARQSEGGVEQEPEPGTAQARGSTRRTAVAAPDEATARVQWEANPRAHGYFDHSFSRYLSFVPAFAARGIDDAARYLGEQMVQLTFFGRRQDGHRDLAGPLGQAEAALAGRTLDPPVSRFGCLNVRFIAGTHRLSFHGLGRAIDLNAPGNPHIKDARDFLVIRALTGTDLRQERAPARLVELSRQFQRDFTPAWVSAQTAPDVAAALARDDVRRRLTHYAQSGFCTLDTALIDALLAAGLRWGGSWSTSKDFMHFELA